MGQYSCQKITESHNGLALVTGVSFWVLNFDNCFEKIPEGARELLLTQCQTIVKTRRGYHFYSSLCTETSELESPTHITFDGKTWVEDGQEGGIDIRAKKGCILAPPTYYKVEKDILRYTWHKGDLSTVAPAPKEILNMLGCLERSVVSINYRPADCKWKLVS